MTTQDKRAFVDSMALMQTVFTPDKPLASTTIDSYWKLFSNWNIEDFTRACIAVTETKTYTTFPLPGEIRNALTTGKSLQAWLMAIDASGKYGAQKTVTFPDPVIHSVIKAMGGWSEFCSMPLGEKKWKQKEFERLYDLMLEKGDHPEQCIGMYYPENQVTYDDKKLIENSDTPLLERR